MKRDSQVKKSLRLAVFNLQSAAKYFLLKTLYYTLDSGYIEFASLE